MWVECCMGWCFFKLYWLGSWGFKIKVEKDKKEKKKRQIIRREI